MLLNTKDAASFHVCVCVCVVEFIYSFHRYLETYCVPGMSGTWKCTGDYVSYLLKSLYLWSLQMKVEEASKYFNRQFNNQ